MARYPAIDVDGIDHDMALALTDDFTPVAAESNDEGRVTLFFATSAQRDGAAAALQRDAPSASVSARDVDDENWAARSQAALGAVSVQRVTKIGRAHV